MTVAPALPSTEVSQLHGTVRTCPLLLTLLYVQQGDAEGMSVWFCPSASPQPLITQALSCCVVVHGGHQKRIGSSSSKQTSKPVFFRTHPVPLPQSLKDNNSKHVNSLDHVPGTTLNVSYVLTFSNNPLKQLLFYPHFVDEETKSKVLCNLPKVTELIRGSDRM